MNMPLHTPNRTNTSSQQS